MALDSHVTNAFKTQFQQLPKPVRQLARKAFRVWAANPSSSGLRFKRVYSRLPVFSVRIGQNWRALAIVKDNTAVWFWIGSHAEYDKVLKTI